MTTINGISKDNLLGNYLNSTSNKNLNAKEIFKELSIDAGSDGKTITKEQLNSYIDKVTQEKDSKTDTTTVSDEELAGLKTLQKNWDAVADGGDEITYSSVSASGFKSALTGMDSADKKVDLSQFNVTSKQDIDNYLMESALSFSTKSSSSSSWQSTLNTLLTGTTDENDDSNANLIATLTNLIAESKKTSTIETEA